ncbi:MAG: anti-sigma factor ChrR (cupin superfamily) [Chlamydiales bacterium]|jgi:anti-sigma factor ChrR (cupin superfamily)
MALQVDTEGVEWRSTKSSGVQWCVLYSATPEGASGKRKASDSTVLIRMEPGHGYPPHRHLDVEEVLVLQGGYEDAFGQHGVGDYVRYEPGTVHAPVASGDPSGPVGPENPACVLFAIARGGIEIE